MQFVGDTQWQDAGSRREAIYTHLAPGSYRFNVIAVNQDGTWNKAGATLEFEVAPTFFQTGWFVTLCVLAAFAVMWLAVFWRLRQLKVRIRLKVEARHEERERIAHELHDTLMQGMQGMLLRLQTWSSDASLGPEHRGDLQRTATQAHAMMVEGRDKIIELRRPSARQRDLSASLRLAGEDYASVHETAFAFSQGGQTRPVARAVEGEILAIVHEALRNAFVHAHAERVTLHIEYTRQHLAITVLDDGCGIHEAILKEGRRAGHWGLVGMRERAGRIGARLSVMRVEPTGTSVHLELPGRGVFDQPWWRIALWRGRPDRTST